MEIELTDGKTPILIRGNHETYCFEICWKKNKKDKDTKEITEYWLPQKWFSGLAACLDYVSKMKITTAEVTTLAELQQQIERVRNELIDCYTTDLEKPMEKLPPARSETLSSKSNSRVRIKK